MGSRFLIRFFIILQGCVAFYACGNKVLSESKMSRVLADIELAQSIYQNKGFEYRTVEAKDALLAGVLEKHGITQAQLDSSLVWYAQRPDRLIKISDSVQALLKRQEQAVELEAEQSKERIFPSLIRLNENSKLYSFRLNRTEFSQADTAAHYAIRFDVLSLDSARQIQAFFYYEYKDTVIERQFDITRTGRYYVSPNNGSEEPFAITGCIALNDTLLYRNGTYICNLNFVPASESAIILKKDSTDSSIQISADSIEESDSIETGNGSRLFPTQTYQQKDEQHIPPNSNERNLPKARPLPLNSIAR
jgi:hypothetical protein